MSITIKIITTVGTSLFTNFLKEDVITLFNDTIESEKSINKKAYNIKDNHKALSKADDKPSDAIIEEHKKQIRAKILHWLTDIQYNKTTDEYTYVKGLGLNTHCCAEVQTLLAIANKDEYKGKTLEVHLLCTDTELSKLAANIIRDSIFPNDRNAAIKVVEVCPIEKLQVKTAKEFENQGFNALLKKVKGIKNLATGFTESGEPIQGFNDNNLKDILINISGGYKAVIPIMTIIGQLEEIPVVYLHEESSELITIGSLPLDFDWHKVEEYYDFLNFADLGVHKDIDSYTEIRDEMITEKVISKISNHPPQYEKTIVGSLIKDFASEKLPTALEVMGFYVELKLLEYYSKREYIAKDNTKYLFPSMREKTELNSLMNNIQNPLTNKVNREIDLFIFEDPYDQKTNFQTLNGGFVTFECKRSNKLIDAIKQSNGQLLNFKKNPKEHCIIVYDEMDYKFDINNNISRIRNGIKRELEKYENRAIIAQVKTAFRAKNIEFRLFFCPIVRNQVIKKGASSRRKSTEYLDFMSSTITIQEYTNF